MFYVIREEQLYKTVLMDRKTLIEVGLNIKRDLGIPKKVNIESIFLTLLFGVECHNCNNCLFNIVLRSYRRILAWIRAHISIDYS